MEQKWVQAWGMSHAGMSLLGYRGNDRTFRLTVHSAVSGGQIRLSLSNRFSKERVRSVPCMPPFVMKQGGG